MCNWNTSSFGKLKFISHHLWYSSFQIRSCTTTLMYVNATLDRSDKLQCIYSCLSFMFWVGTSGFATDGEGKSKYWINTLLVFVFS